MAERGTAGREVGRAADALDLGADVFGRRFVQVDEGR